MSKAYPLTLEEKSELAQLFDDAATSIIVHGWQATGRNINDTDESPRCIWIAILNSMGTPIDEAVNTHIYDKYIGDIEDLICAQVGVSRTDQLFHLNDSMSEEEGPKWSVENLRSVATKLRSGAPVEVQPLKETDTVTTL